MVGRGLGSSGKPTRVWTLPTSYAVDFCDPEVAYPCLRSFFTGGGDGLSRSPVGDTSTRASR